jgi:hypothetical protein
MGQRVPYSRNSPAYYRGSNTALLTNGGLEFKDGTVVHPYAGDPNGVLILPIGSIVMDTVNSELYQATDSGGTYRAVGSSSGALTIGRGLTGDGSVGEPLRMSGEYHPQADSTTAFEVRKANGTTPVFTVDSLNNKVSVTASYSATASTDLTNKGSVDNYLALRNYRGTKYNKSYYVRVGGNDTHEGTSYQRAFATIQHAINTAEPYSYVIIEAGTYEITTQIIVEKPLYILGAGRDVTTIQMQVGIEDRCLWVKQQHEVVIDGLHFTGGRKRAGVAPDTLSGGGVFIGGQDGWGTTQNVISSYIINCKVSDCNTNGTGGGISLHDYKAAAINCIVENCQTVLNANGAGGGIYLRWEAYARGCYVTGCSAPYGGGITAQNGASRIENCTITANTGSNVLAFSVTLSIVNSIIKFPTTGSDVSAISATVRAFSNCTTYSAGSNGNFNSDPLLTGFVISRLSPCLDVGILLDWHTSMLDIEAKKRINFKGKVSIGCYEYEKNIIVDSTLGTADDTDLIALATPSGTTEKITLDSFKAFLKTYFDTLYGGDGMAFANVEVSGTQSIPALTEVELATYTVPAGLKAQWLSGNGSGDGLTRFRVTADGTDRIVPTWNSLAKLTVELHAPLEFAAGTVLRVFGYNDTLEGNTNSVSATLYLKTVSV